MTDPEPGRFPGYDVLAKRRTPSWDRKTREVIDERLAVSRDPRFFTLDEHAAVLALAARIVPQAGADQVPVAALVDDRLHKDQGDGYRKAGTPRERDAWRQGLRALDAEARTRHGAPFARLDPAEQDGLLRRMQAGELRDPAWGDMPARSFFTDRMARDLVRAYYSHPAAWSRIGWGGPASPRGYVRLGYDKRDPWEAAEVRDGDVAAARRRNRHVG